jgi:ABC-type multidrug transport system fused ATPase/permease subunit
MLMVVIAIQLLVSMGFRYGNSWVNEALHAGLRGALVREILAKPLRFFQALAGGLDIAMDAGTLGFLSGGQIQQICLARALYRQAPVLTMDEPDTSLDGDALKRAAAIIAAQTNRATIVVSHRREILDVCGRIYEFTSSDEPGILFVLRERPRRPGPLELPSLGLGR